jgi:sulfhydrogenase subunit alpha
MKAKTKTIRVNTLARVEGEGGLTISIQGDRIQDVRLRIFEPPRFMEELLRGRSFLEAPDITARICGICPVAYQLSAAQAAEDAFGVAVSDPVRALRRLLLCGEWIESHILHIYLLHVPDFLGYADALAMAADHPDIVQRGLRLKKIGNQLVTAVGGREIHPVNVRVGGFYRMPESRELEVLTEPLMWGREAALETLAWVATLPFPDFEQDYEFVALHPAEATSTAGQTHPAYPFAANRIVSSKGLDIAVRDFETHFIEDQVDYSTALRSQRESGVNYLVGPLARFSLNFLGLSPSVQEAARQVALTPVCRNPFRSILVRSVEVLQACEEALEIIASYKPPAEPAARVVPRAARGVGSVEAPRGILYQRYDFDAAGNIVAARIVPPTAQNQRTIESDLRAFLPGRLGLPQDELIRQSEQVVRNYDPCISCATHALNIRVESLYATSREESGYGLL